MNRFLDPYGSLGPTKIRAYRLFVWFAIGTILSLIPAPDASLGVGKDAVVGFLFLAPVVGLAAEWLNSGANRSTRKLIDGALANSFFPVLAPWFFGVALWGMSALDPHTPKDFSTISRICLDSGGFLAAIGAMLWLQAMSRIFAEESFEPDDPLAYSGPGLAPYLDPYGSLGPARAELGRLLIALLIVFAMFGWFALAGISAVVPVILPFCRLDPGVFERSALAPLGVSPEEAKASPTVTRNVVFLLFFVGLVVAGVFLSPTSIHHSHDGFFLVDLFQPKGYWFAGAFGFLAPVGAMIYRVRRLSWLAWQAKMRAEGAA